VRAVGVIALALVLASAASGGSSVADNAALVFQRSTGNFDAIYGVSADGTHLTQLTEGPNDTAPAWSPDGTHIAFLRGRDLVVMDAKARNRRKLTHGALSSGWFAWSPDSTQIAFDDERRGLQIIDLAGHRRTLSRLFLLGPPLWSPDGESILFLTEEGLRLIPAGGGKTEKLPETDAVGTYGYAWAARGRTIAFMSTIPFTGNEALVFIRGDGAREQIATLFGENNIAWSPDGTRLAVTGSTPEETSYLGVLRIADRSLTRLVDASDCSPPSWSLDSQLLAFQRPTCSLLAGSDLYRIDASGAGLVRLAKDGSQPTWDPLGRAVPTPPHLPQPNVTRIYDARGRQAGFVFHEELSFWAVSWLQYPLGAAITARARAMSGECGERRVGTARLVSAVRWTVTVKRLRAGELRRASSRRWNVYDRRGRKVASTSGPDGPVAGFAWLALRDC
jgi:Tol biopolymer transport system component